MIRALLLALLLWTSPERARAHSLTMSVLTLKEVGPGEYLASWSQLQGVLDPSSAFLLLRPVFPEHCRFQAPRLSCGARGLSGRLGFLGLGELSSAATMQLERPGQPARSFTFDASRPELEFAGQPSDLFTGLRAFVALGVEHILLGWDHLAFLLGLLWLVAGKRALLYTVTAFTLGHSATLILAALGYTALPGPPVEAVIALSIAFVAAEAVQRERGARPGLAARAPWWVAAAFGLLHGLGFANALAELNLARVELPLALLGFNLGVELGQLVFVALVLSLGQALSCFARAPSAALKPFVPYALGGLAMYWLIQRVALFGDPL